MNAYGIHLKLSMHSYIVLHILYWYNVNDVVVFLVLIQYFLVTLSVNFDYGYSTNTLRSSYPTFILITATVGIDSK